MLGKILLALIASTAILVPAFTAPEITVQLRWFYAVLTELLAVALLVCAGPLFRVAFGRVPHPAPAHRHTPDLAVAHRENYTIRMPTLPFASWPEKRLVVPSRVAISQPASIPVALAHSPDIVLVPLADKNHLLRHRRELRLASSARFFRTPADLVPLLPAGPDRDISSYVLCGDPLFLADTHELLTRIGVPYAQIATEQLSPAPTLPGGHPSAPFIPASYVDAGASSAYVRGRGTSV